jgi:hypothetical protein
MGGTNVYIKFWGMAFLGAFDAFLLLLYFCVLLHGPEGTKGVYFLGLMGIVVYTCAYTNLS